MPDPTRPQHDSRPNPLIGFANTAATLQSQVNLHIGWMIIHGLPIPPELCDANANLVQAARHLRNAAQHDTNDAPGPAEQAARQEASAHGR